MDDAELRDRAAAVLRRNDRGDFTQAAPDLYPHQWSWDSAFIAIGLARVDPLRAVRELQGLLAAQWPDGRVPHIVFHPDPGDRYFPDASFWDTGRGTSGLCQPPVHAIAALAIRDAAPHDPQVAAALEDLGPRLLAWHRYLATARDPDGSGLVTIYHPWESGMDNSPRWNAAMAAVNVGAGLPAYRRRDLAHVADPSERPTDEDYDRFLWLVLSLRDAGYDDERVRASHPFLLTDVFFSAILVAANEALAELFPAAADACGAWARRGRRGLSDSWDAELGLALDHDLRTGSRVRVRTLGGFAPLIAGGLGEEITRRQVQMIDSGDFCAATDLRWPLPPSTSPEEPAFHPRSYWRGPVWPVMNWLLWWSLGRAGAHVRAARLRDDSLDQVRTSGFAEYVEPYTGAPLGSPDQAWTAAVVLDWLAQPTSR